MLDLKRVTTYCELHSSHPDEVLKGLERETHLKTLSPQMVTGHLQGLLLSMISEWIKPNTILEIGTFTGYGTICLAKGLQEKGILHTIEVNPELAYIAQKYFRKAGMIERIEQHLGDAKKIIPQLNEQFDLVFIDAGKHEYGLHYDLIIEKVKTGGVILADNVLWSGKVGIAQGDRDTVVLEAFNQKINEDGRVRNLLLPIRDGLMIAVKN